MKRKTQELRKGVSAGDMKHGPIPSSWGRLWEGWLGRQLVLFRCQRVLLKYHTLLAVNGNRERQPPVGGGSVPWHTAPVCGYRRGVFGNTVLIFFGPALLCLMTEIKIHMEEVKRCAKDQSP